MRALEISGLVATATAISVSSSSNFNAAANTNLAVYWGQGAGQQRLSHFCEDSSIDIIPISFLNVFPDQGENGYPGTNFGNQCGDETYKTPLGGDTQLLSNCALIGPDIKTCQSLGKKILLSLGGAIPTDQSIDNDASAVSFSNFLWSAFGPVVEGYEGPRPFGDAVVDGFDFDIENHLKDGQDPSALYRGYATMITTLRGFYALDKKTKDYYISGAPQCVVQDAHLADAIEKSWFDFIFVQFYNTPQCSARAFFDRTYGAYGGPPTNISFDAWASFVSTSSMNPGAKLYLGLPAAPSITYDSYMYLQPEEAGHILKSFQCKYPELFGGAMVYEASASEANAIDGISYADAVKQHLKDSTCAPKPSTTSTVSSSTSQPTSSAVGPSIPSLISSTPATTLQPTASALNSTVSILSSSSSGTASSTPQPTSSVIRSTASPPATNSITLSSGPASTVPYNSSSHSVGTIQSSLLSSYQPSGGVSANSPHLPSGYNYTATYGPTALQSRGPSGSSSYPTQKISSSSMQYNATTVGASSGLPTAAIIPAASSMVPSSAPSGYLYSSGFPHQSSNLSSSATSYQYPSLPTTVVSESASLSSYHSEAHTTPTLAASPVMPYSHATISESATPSKLSYSAAAAVTNSNSVTLAAYSATIPEKATTEIVTSYKTTCPVTHTTTYGGATYTQTSLAVSVVYSTITSTISDAVPLASSVAKIPEVTTTEITTSYTTTCPVTHTTTYGGATYTQTSLAVSVVYSTITSTISNVVPLASSVAKIPEVTTTEIVTSYTTTCPVTHTTTYGGATYTQTSSAVSVVYSTITSTVSPPAIHGPTKGASSSPEGSIYTHQRPHGVAHLASHVSNVHGHGSPNHSGNAGAEGTGSSPQQLNHESLSHAASAQVHGSGNAGSEGANSPQHQHEASTFAASPSPSGPQGGESQGTESHHPQSGNSASNGNQRYGIGPAKSGAQGEYSQPSAKALHDSAGYGKAPVSPVQSLASTTLPTGIITKLVTATKVPVAASPNSGSAVNAISEGSSSASAPLVTQTIIPVPVKPGQYSQPAGGIPFPSGNSTSVSGASASGTPSASASGGSSAGLSSQPSAVQFTGAGSRPFVGSLCALGAAVGAILVF